MFRINPLKSKDFMTSNKFMLTHARYLIYILIHNRLNKSKLISNVNIFTIETDILLFSNNRFLIKELLSEIEYYIILRLGINLNYINILQPVYFKVFLHGNLLQCTYNQRITKPIVNINSILIFVIC